MWLIVFSWKRELISLLLFEISVEDEKSCDGFATYDETSIKFIHTFYSKNIFPTEPTEEKVVFVTSDVCARKRKRKCRTQASLMFLSLSLFGAVLQDKNLVCKDKIQSFRSRTVRTPTPHFLCVSQFIYFVWHSLLSRSKTRGEREERSFFCSWFGSFPCQTLFGLQATNLGAHLGCPHLSDCGRCIMKTAATRTIWASDIRVESTPRRRSQVDLNSPGCSWTTSDSLVLFAHFRISDLSETQRLHVSSNLSRRRCFSVTWRWRRWAEPSVPLLGLALFSVIWRKTPCTLQHGHV